MSSANTTPATNTNDGVDPSLFPDKATMDAAAYAWNAGLEEEKLGKPQGTFTATIEEAILTTAASSGTFQIKYTLKLIGGTSDGRVLMKFDGMKSPAQTSITQQQLKAIGVDTSKITIDRLPAVLLTLQGKKVVIKTKVNGEFFNISFVRPTNESITNRPQPTVAAKAGGGKGNRPKF